MRQPAPSSGVGPLPGRWTPARQCPPERSTWAAATRSMPWTPPPARSSGRSRPGERWYRARPYRAAGSTSAPTTTRSTPLTRRPASPERRCLGPVLAVGEVRGEAAGDRGHDRGAGDDQAEFAIAVQRGAGEVLRADE